MNEEWPLYTTPPSAHLKFKYCHLTAAAWPQVKLPGSPDLFTYLHRIDSSLIRICNYDKNFAISLSNEVDVIVWKLCCVQQDYYVPRYWLTEACLWI
jgi:hypothetical protein